MKDYLFVLSSNPEDASKSTRCFQFAKLAAMQGHDTTVFLIDSAVYLGTDIITHVKSITGDSAFEHYKHIIDNELPVSFKLCTPCCSARNITTEDTLEGFEFGTGTELINLMEHSVVITL